jgi:hypothetical protein
MQLRWEKLLRERQVCRYAVTSCNSATSVLHTTIIQCPIICCTLHVYQQHDEIVPARRTRVPQEKIRTGK